jgi:hypothetical protein
MPRLLMAAVLLIGLAACEQTKTQDYYMSHPDELAADLAACKEHKGSAYNCNEADKAAYFLSHKNQ